MELWTTSGQKIINDRLHMMKELQEEATIAAKNNQEDVEKLQKHMNAINEAYNILMANLEAEIQRGKMHQSK